jgi:starvation-inducible outer membrane lipoprotein
MMRLALIPVVALGLAACAESPQDVAQKSGKYAGKVDAKPYEEGPSKMTRAEWERNLRARADNQNEYKRAN